MDEDCFRTFEEVCPVPALARSSIDLECGETLQSIEGGTRDGDFCCYEVTITRGYCPDPY